MAGLWKTEGFKDLSPGEYGSEISSYIEFHDTMYFLNDGAIMKSDGTLHQELSILISHW
jgi:hypothetical protein